MATIASAANLSTTVSPKAGIMLENVMGEGAAITNADREKQTQLIEESQRRGDAIRSGRSSIANHKSIPSGSTTASAADADHREMRKS